MKKFLFTDCAAYNEELYFFGSLSGMPAKYNFAENKISYVPEMLMDILDADDIIEKVLITGELLIGLSQKGKYGCIYNLNNQKHGYVRIYADERLWGNYIFTATYKNVGYVFTRNKVIQINGFQPNVLQQKICEGEDLICGCRKDNDIWLFYENGNMYLHYDLITDTMQKCYMGSCLSRVIDAVEHDNIIYVLEGNGTICLLKPYDGYIETYVKTNTNGTFGKLAATEEKLIVLPDQGKDIIMIDWNTKKQSVYSQYPDHFLYLGEQGWSKYYGSCETERKIIFAMQSANHILIIDKKDGEFQWIKPILPCVQEEVEYWRDSKSGLVKERGITLESFIHGTQDIKRVAGLQEIMGKRIWNVMRGC